MKRDHVCNEELAKLEARFFEHIGLIAEKHGAIIEVIENEQGGTINYKCDKDISVELAFELEELHNNMRKWYRELLTRGE